MHTHSGFPLDFLPSPLPPTWLSLHSLSQFLLYDSLLICIALPFILSLCERLGQRLRQLLVAEETALCFNVTERECVCLVLRVEQQRNSARGAEGSRSHSSVMLDCRVWSESWCDCFFPLTHLLYALALPHRVQVIESRPTGRLTAAS